MASDLDSIRSHYETVWGATAHVRSPTTGRTWELPRGFQVLAFPPRPKRSVWTYATCGMSEQRDAIPIEIHLFSPVETEAHVELLTAITHYHVTGEYIDLGHTVNFGRPWLPGSACDRGLISLPYLDGPTLEWLEMRNRRIRFLWLIPITAAELEYKKSNGLDALESHFESRNFAYADPLRRSVV